MSASSTRHNPPHPHHGGDHEHADVHAAAIVRTAIGLLVVGVIVQVAMAGLFIYFERRAERRDTSPPPLVTEAARPSTHPRLQANPAQELKVMREEQRQALYSYGWVDEANGVVRLPIDRAMKIMLERGYPVRPGGSHETRKALGSSSGRFAPGGEP